MKITDDFIHTLAFALVILAWFAFALAFLLRPKAPAATESKRDPTSRLGIALQGVGYALVWAVHRPYFTPLLPAAGRAANVALSCVAVVVAFASSWMVVAAARALGKQWSLTARVVEGHRLVTEGPYRLVRHPIYTGMLGMLVATGLVTSHWWALPFALAAFLFGTFVRVRSEERLLRETFGGEFDAYAR